MQGVLLEILYMILPLLAVGLVALVVMGLRWLKKKGDLIDNKYVKGLKDDAIEELERVAKDAILYTQQTLVEELKEKSEDGKLTKEEAKEALETAKEYFYDNVSDSTLDLVSSLIGPAEDWLEEFLEAKLGESKEMKEVLELADPKQ